ncbi:MAG: hypothetical protein G01um101431_1000 [Parcubacteria group bacterium Gr01-1014_31]|nr:MAG: hypothetical protein G01um101431_1000 [Parcubacteria group bacterium Gr01-1014_31]
MVAGTLVAYQSVGAFGLNVGGRITFAQPCVVDNISLRCEECALCSNLLGPACGGYTEIQWIPSGGTPGQNYICVPKGYLYRGGGKQPRIGAWLWAKMLAPQIPIQVGISP